MREVDTGESVRTEIFITVCYNANLSAHVLYNSMGARSPREHDKRGGVSTVVVVLLIPVGVAGYVLRLLPLLLTAVIEHLVKESGNHQHFGPW